MSFATGVMSYLEEQCGFSPHSLSDPRTDPENPEHLTSNAGNHGCPSGASRCPSRGTNFFAWQHFQSLFKLEL